jgi:chemotaxis protein methyltransferase CheR
MEALRFQLVSDTIQDHASVRIQQGAVHVGPESQQTYLGSCVCVGFYHAGRHLGATSHITGFRQAEGHDAKGALREIERRFSAYGLNLPDCECFVIGGADSARQVYDSAVEELRRRGLRFRELDVLGAFHRKLRFRPADGTLDLFKKPSGKGQADDTSPYFAAPSMDYFQDPRRRIVTGASLFFRNEALISRLADTVLPEVVRTADRCHIWCAGCSTGMEVYSLGMVALHYLERARLPGFELRLLGTDISQGALDQARSGEYSVTQRAEERFAHLFRQYCEKVDAQRMRMGPELRAVARFREHDIRQGSRRHLFELVACDHVLQYFPPDVQLEFLNGLRTGVRPGGYLYVSSPSNRVRDTLLTSGEYEVIEPSFYRRQQR